MMNGEQDETITKTKQTIEMKIIINTASLNHTLLHFASPRSSVYNLQTHYILLCLYQSSFADVIDIQS